MKRFLGITTAFALTLLCSSCYTLKNNTIPVDMKTVNVQFFENNAPLVVNNLSQTFTEALKDRIRTQTRLSLVRGEADATMSGAITGYSIAPVSIEATSNNVAPIADANRLTITVRVKFSFDAAKTAPDKKLSFEESFTKFANYRGDIGSQEQALIQQITKQLIDDIFNRAFSNW
ncbi:lipopolysaccharide assembly protein [Mucilaginibacter oryzae]|uniref:Lipopolysaccharide assembly protein n=1 Tax=Mucilaginibacter oryzae TaxID=468058 RepID=A0A316H693_9SPHI|nr:LptE family protein [Mucilaginibacter oryzae]PWK76494.1 lipopolysaccharide assembly protein [Mucilaginibacter oryzae]